MMTRTLEPLLQEPSNNVVGTLVYAQRDNRRHDYEKPYNMRFDPGSGIPSSNMEYETRKMKIQDLRLADFEFHRHGLQMVEHQSAMAYEDYASAFAVEDIYLPEVAEVLRKRLNTQDVFVFEWVIRRRDPDFPKASVDLESHEQPAITAHIDFTEADILDRVNHMFGSKAPAMLARPFMAVNAWKPLRGPVRDWPLAYCDPATVNIEADLLAVDEVSRKNASELYNLHYNSSHTWYYVKDQQPWEMVLFGEYDSRRSLKGSVPHCAFVLDNNANGPRRESIEVRAVAFL